MSSQVIHDHERHCICMHQLIVSFSKSPLHFHAISASYFNSHINPSQFSHHEPLSPAAELNRHRLLQQNSPSIFL